MLFTQRTRGYAEDRREIPSPLAFVFRALGAAVPNTKIFQASLAESRGFGKVTDFALVLTPAEAVIPTNRKF